MKSICRSSRRMPADRKHISTKLTRAKMEQLCDDLFERTITPVKNCLKDAGMAAERLTNLCSLAV